MKKTQAKIDGVLVNLYIVEDLSEYKEGIRLLGGKLKLNEAVLFDFGKSINILMENSGVMDDISVLYFHKFNRTGIVQKIGEMKQNSADVLEAGANYQIAVEVKSEFVRMHNIKEGSIIILGN